MVFIKSLLSDEDTQVYFDTFDNKYIRKNGTLAWRCNNPGLVHSHSNIKNHKAIGHNGELLVFPDMKTGREALISWVKLKSYYKKPLSHIAEHQSPTNPHKYLSKLCTICGLNAKVSPDSLTNEQFEKLIWGIEELTGAREKVGNEIFLCLPKIRGRIISKSKKVDHYLIADGRILLRDATIAEVKENRIDAVVVCQSNGMEFLRSRPGHIFGKIYLKDSNLNDCNIKEIAYEAGHKRNGQIVWGFINGILNYTSLAKQNLAQMVKIVNGEQVWGFSNPTGREQIGGLPDLCSMKSGTSPNIVSDAIEYFKFLIYKSEKDHQYSPIVIVAHSEGAVIAETAIKQLPIKLSKKLTFITLGGASLIPDGICCSNTINYINQHDKIVRIILPNDYRLLITRDQNIDKSDEYIANFLAEEDVIASGFDFGPAYKFTKDEKSKKYKIRLEELKNTKILYSKNKSGMQHAFADPHYQKVLKDFVNLIYGKK